MANFNYDEDFLKFLISYALGRYIEGPAANEFKEYASIDGLYQLMRLDEYGYYGSKLYKIYEICGKNKMKFIESVKLIGSYAIGHILEKDSIDLNLELEHPVPFIDDSITLSTGKTPVFNPNENHFCAYKLSWEEVQEFIHEAERSFRKRINNSIIEYNENKGLLNELLPYSLHLEMERRKKAEYNIPDEYEIDINSIYYGLRNDGYGDASKIKSEFLSFFENTDINMGHFRLFRSVPTGIPFFLDDIGKVYVPKEIFSQEGFKVDDSSSIRNINIFNIIYFVEQFIKKLE